MKRRNLLPLALGFCVLSSDLTACKNEALISRISQIVAPATFEIPKRRDRDGLFGRKAYEAVGDLVWNQSEFRYLLRSLRIHANAQTPVANILVDAATLFAELDTAASSAEIGRCRKVERLLSLLGGFSFVDP